MRTRSAPSQSRFCGGASEPRASASGALAQILIVLAFPAHGEVLDRIAVTVDKQVIAESDIIRYIRVSAFLDAKPVDLSGASKRAAAATLVDQALMMAEAADSHFVLPTAQDVAPLVEQVKMQYPSEAEFSEALKKYHITEPDLANHLLAGERALRFTDLRFRPEVDISDQDLQAAYNAYVSNWRSSHAEAPPSLEDSREDLEKLLTDQRALKLLDQWMETARMQKHVEYREAAFQ